MSEEYISPRGHTWNEVFEELLTPEERAKSDFSVAMMIALEKSNAKKSRINKTLLQVDKILEILAPLGKTLNIVDLPTEKN